MFVCVCVVWDLIRELALRAPRNRPEEATKVCGPTLGRDTLNSIVVCDLWAKGRQIILLVGAPSSSEWGDALQSGLMTRLAEMTESLHRAEVERAAREKHALQWQANAGSSSLSSRSWLALKRERQNDANSRQQRDQLVENNTTELHANSSELRQRQDRTTSRMGPSEPEKMRRDLSGGGQQEASGKHQAELSNCHTTGQLSGARPPNCDHSAGRRRVRSRPPLLQQANPSVILVNCCLLAIVAELANYSSAYTPADWARQKFATQPDAKYLVAAGSTVRLPCLVSNRVGRCSWMSPGPFHKEPGKRHMYAEFPANGDCSILIRNVSSLSDDGNWRCQVLTGSEDEDNQHIQSRNALLVVLVAPERPQFKDLVSCARF